MSLSTKLAFIFSLSLAGISYSGSNPLEIVSINTDANEASIAYDDTSVITLPGEVATPTVGPIAIIVIEKPKEEESLTPAEFAVSTAAHLGAIALYYYFTADRVKNMEAGGYLKPTVELIDKAIVAGIGGHWIGEASKAKFGSLKKKLISLGKKAINVAEEATATEKTSKVSVRLVSAA